MGFDILLHTCNLGTRKKRVKNPFTGASMTTFDDPGLTADERAAVEKLLKVVRARGPDDFGTYSLSLPDGGEADLSAPALRDGSKFDGCSVQTRSLTPDVAAFLFRLSRAGNLIMMPAMEGAEALVTTQEQREKIATRWSHPKLVRSATALRAELLRGFEAWQRYRNQLNEDME